MEHHANQAWDLIKSYKDAKDQMHEELEQEEREMLQKEVMRGMEEEAIYNSGVHEYSNYLVKQNKSWRHSSLDRDSNPH